MPAATGTARPQPSRAGTARGITRLMTRRLRSPWDPAERVCGVRALRFSAMSRVSPRARCRWGGAGLRPGRCVRADDSPWRFCLSPGLSVIPQPRQQTCSKSHNCFKQNASIKGGGIRITSLFERGYNLECEYCSLALWHRKIILSESCCQQGLGVSGDHISLQSYLVAETGASVFEAHAWTTEPLSRPQIPFQE